MFSIYVSPEEEKRAWEEVGYDVQEKCEAISKLTGKKFLVTRTPYYTKVRRSCLPPFRIKEEHTFVFQVLLKLRMKGHYRDVDIHGGLIHSVNEVNAFLNGVLFLKKKE